MSGHEGQSVRRPESGGTTGPADPGAQASPVVITRVIPLSIVIAACVVAGLWRLPKMRLWVVDNLGPLRLVQLESALHDSNADVAVNACQHLLSRPESELSPASVDLLYRRPDVAMRCLNKFEPANQQQHKRTKPAAVRDATRRVKVTIVSWRQLLAVRLAKRWMANIDKDEGRACDRAASARKALTFAGNEANYPLLRCAVMTSSDKVRQCCIGALGGEKKFASLLDQPEAVPVRTAARDLQSLVKATFLSEASDKAKAVAEKADDAKTEATRPDPEAKTGIQKAVAAANEAIKQPAGAAKDHVQTAVATAFGAAKRAGTPVADTRADAVREQDWVVELGCRVHFQDPTRRAVVRSFQPLIESPDCSPGKSVWQDFYDSQSWSELCSGMYSDGRAQSLPPRRAICHSLVQASVENTIGEASDILQTSLTLARQDAQKSRSPLIYGGETDFGPVPPYPKRGQPQPYMSRRASLASQSIFGSLARQLFQ